MNIIAAKNPTFRGPVDFADVFTMFQGLSEDIVTEFQLSAEESASKKEVTYRFIRHDATISEPEIVNILKFSGETGESDGKFNSAVFLSDAVMLVVDKVPYCLPINNYYTPIQTADFLKEAGHEYASDMLEDIIMITEAWRYKGRNSFEDLFYEEAAKKEQEAEAEAESTEDPAEPETAE